MAFRGLEGREFQIVGAATLNLRTPFTVECIKFIPSLSIPAGLTPPLSAPAMSSPTISAVLSQHTVKIISVHPRIFCGEFSVFNGEGYGLKGRGDWQRRKPVPDGLCRRKSGTSGRAGTEFDC